MRAGRDARAIGASSARAQAAVDPGGQTGAAMRPASAVAAVAELGRAASDLEGFLARLPATIAAHVGAARLLLWRLEGEELHAQPHAHGVAPRERRALPPVACRPFAGRPVDRVVHEDVALRGSAGDGAPPPGLPPARDWLLVGWRLGRTPLGMITACDSHCADGFSPIDAYVLQAAATAAALVYEQRGALERERASSDEQRRRVRELSQMQEIARQLVSTLDSESALDELVLAAARIAAAPASEPGLALVFPRDGGPQAGDVSGPFVQALRRHVDYVLGSGRPVQFALDEVPHGPAREHLVQARIGSVALVPIPVGDETFGVLAVGCREPAAIAPERLRRLALLADLGGLAIANGRHFEAVRREGERVAALEGVKTQFLRLASHELRGPLAILRGYVSMLRDGTFEDRPEDLPGIYTILDAKAGQMELLVTQMLEAARLEEGRLRLDMRPIDLRLPVRDAFDSVRPVARPVHQLSLEQPGEPVEVVADAGRITTIVANLLDNAIKYSPDGGPVRCTIRLEPGAAVVDVADRGLGIAAADHGALFTRFGRVETPHNRHIQGTGLGLYLSRELAQAQGATLTAASEAGAGSTFTLRIPLAAAGPIPEGPPQPPAATPPPDAGARPSA